MGKPADAGFSTFTTTGITTPVTFADATMTYSLDATAKIYTPSTTATYTGADEAAAKTVYDQALSGASATVQGVATALTGGTVKLAKTQVIALVAGSLSNIVAAHPPLPPSPWPSDQQHTRYARQKHDHYSEFGLTL